MKKSKLALCVLLVFFSVSLFAENIKPFVLPSARASGFGGIHAAQGDDFSSLFSNPASFVDVEKQFSAAELSISLYGPIFELIDLGMNSSGSIDISNLVGPGGFAAGLDMGGPLALGWIGSGLGFGVFNRTVMDARVTSTQIRPVVSEELLLLGGYSFRVIDTIDHTFDIGFLGKGYYRASLNLESSIFNVADMVNGVMSRPFETHFGLGVDVGLKYTYGGKFSLALAGYDIFSPALITRYTAFSDYGSGGVQSYATVTPRLALGMMYRIRNDFLDRYISDFIVMLDYRDMLDPLISLIPRHPLLNVSLGAEITLLKILRLRAGIADALPSLGFGIDMKVLQFDFAMRGKETGLDPGVQSVYAVDIGFLFRY